MGSDLAVFSGLDAAVRRKEWEKGKSAHIHRERRQGNVQVKEVLDQKTLTDP